MAGDIAQLTELLVCMHEAQSSIPSTAQNKYSSHAYHPNTSETAARRTGGSRLSLAINQVSSSNGSKEISSTHYINTKDEGIEPEAK